jgi:hypothetical protein
MGANECLDRAIYSIVAEAPETAFVKGGLFAKAGIDLPVATVQIWMKRKEKWEMPFEGMEAVE